jgi:hypothetical protein
MSDGLRDFPFKKLFLPCIPKTGNTYIRRFLQQYLFEITMKMYPENKQDIRKNRRFLSFTGIDTEHYKVDLRKLESNYNRGYRHFYGHIHPDEIFDSVLANAGSKFIVLERNYWDVYASWIDHQKLLQYDAYSPHDGKGGENFFEEFLLPWCCNFSTEWRRFSRKAPEQFNIIDYDDFARDQISVLRSIIEFIGQGVPVDAQIFDKIYFHTESLKEDGDHNGSKGHRNGVKFNFGIPGRGIQFKSNSIFAALEQFHVNRVDPAIGTLATFPRRPNQPINP